MDRDLPPSVCCAGLDSIFFLRKVFEKKIEMECIMVLVDLTMADSSNNEQALSFEEFCSQSDGENCSKSSNGEGNSKSSPINPAVRWCFTYNNYDDEGEDWLQSTITNSCRYAIYGREVGEQGTPHLQGYIEFKQKKRPLEVFKRKCLHWEKCRGTKQDNINYCSKSSKTMWLFPKEHIINTIDPGHFYDWQAEVADELELTPDNRTVNWIIGKEGNEGKTSFQKYLAVHKGAFILGGKASDIRCACLTHKQQTGKTPELICVNIPRSYQSFVSYEGLENIKDMLFYSGKYEGGMVIGNCPHLYVFANEAPDITKMSGDRWNIRNIRNKKLEEYEQEETPLDDI